MKRYFVADAIPEGYNPRGLFHYADLPAGGHVVVVCEEGSHVPPDWVQLPHLLDNSPAGFNGTHAKLGEPPHPDHAPLADCAPTDSTYQVAKKLARHVAFFTP